MKCPKCGTSNDDNARRCQRCQEPVQAPGAGQVYAPPAGQPPTGRMGDDPAMRLLLPVGRSGLAIVAGYLGLLSFLLPIGPLAILCGVLAMRDLKAHPEKHGMGRVIFGFIIGGLNTAALLWFLVIKLSR